MVVRSSLRVACVAGAMSLGVGCGSSEKDGSAPLVSEGGSSGLSPTGGRPASGGTKSDGGGAQDTGGRNTTGGRGAIGGSDATGGSDASGGRASSAGAAGEGAAGSLGDGGEGGGAGGSEPAAGECREVARYRFSTGDHSLSNYAVARIPGGFLLSADPSSSAPTIIADETGKSREIPRELADRNPSVVIGAWFAAGSASDPRFINIRRVDDPDVNQVYTGYFSVQSFLESGAALGEERQVLEIFTRGTAMNHFARSWDGERVALGNVEPVVRDPRMVLVSKDGAPISDEIRVLDTGDSPLINCFEIRGTPHGAVAVAADRGLLLMRIVELGAAGEVVQEYTFPDSACPFLLPDATGIYFTWPGIPRDVYRLADGVPTRVVSLPDSTLEEGYSWFAGGEEPLIHHRLQSEASFARVKNGTLVPLSGTFSGDALASALDGRIFFLTYEDKAVGVVEVACGRAE